jgi:membrane associated rhomboid family serine protease
MFPIRDTIPSKRFPLVNYGIIAINIFVYVIVNLGHWDELERYFFLYGLVPARFTDPFLRAHFSLMEQACSIVTFMFLHGGFLHLLGNMWSLYIFGDNVEDRLGPLWYLVFYLASGIASGLVHFISEPSSVIPTVGASGAIAGVMGAYFLLYPHSKVLTMIPIFFLPYLVELPAVIFLGMWLLTQFFGAALTPAGVGGIAWWAHIGGFITGAVLIKFFKDRPTSSKWDWLTKQKTPSVHVLHTFGPVEENNLYARLPLSPKEALLGTKKLIAVPYGERKRSFLITIPPGITDGSIIRLKGLGRRDPYGIVGDLYLKIDVTEV